MRASSSIVAFVTMWPKREWVVSSTATSIEDVVVTTVSPSSFLKKRVVTEHAIKEKKNREIRRNLLLEFDSDDERNGAMRYGRTQVCILDI
ncbi:hypothetical protein V6N11_073105 [Hibiscus sabdariffa]|uniref:Uncharacterized protein n=1 Tax=Hibiscus sabdariffa TaxID=183260 RepID=A0ABR2P945_9ROSI